MALDVGQPQLVQHAQPPRAPLGRGQASFGFNLVGDEQIPECRIVTMHIDGSAREMSVVPVTLRHRVRDPTDRGFAPTRDRDNIVPEFLRKCFGYGDQPPVRTEILTALESIKPTAVLLDPTVQRGTSVALPEP